MEQSAGAMLADLEMLNDAELRRIRSITVAGQNPDATAQPIFSTIAGDSVCCSREAPAASVVDGRDSGRRSQKVRHRPVVCVAYS
jgi:hypothetical protein